MIAAAYLIPVAACLVLHFGLGYRGDWPEYLTVLVIGEGVTSLLHRFFYRSQTTASEYLGSIVTAVYFEDSWVELIERHETRTDSRGREYTVKRIDHHYHPEQYYFDTSIGSRYGTNAGFYNYVRDLWQLRRRDDCWSGSHIRGGSRYGCHYTMEDFTIAEADDPRHWVPLTEESTYVNKIRRSNSIFKFERIGRIEAIQEGLFDYPKVDGFDAPCILSHGFPVEQEVHDMFDKFNARYAAAVEMRLYILLFPASAGVGIAERQRAYWQGGNKNEMTVCIGLTDGMRVEWARAFSWADDQSVEVETAQWLMDNPQLDWRMFHNWLQRHIRSWRRKEFSDFDYIQVSLPLWQCLAVYAMSAAASALAVYLVISR